MLTRLSTGGNMFSGANATQVDNMKVDRDSGLDRRRDVTLSGTILLRGLLFPLGKFLFFWHERLDLVRSKSSVMVGLK